MTKKRTDQSIARADVTRVSALNDDFIAIVRALAKRRAREDHAMEASRRNSAKPSIE